MKTLDIIGDKLKEMKNLSQIGSVKEATKIAYNYIMALELRKLFQEKCINKKVYDCIVKCNPELIKLSKELQSRGVGFDVVEESLVVYPVEENQLKFCINESEKENPVDCRCS